jgi:hypothetical protein
MDDADRAASIVTARNAMRGVAHDTFRICATTAETMAEQMDSGALVVEAADACRLLAEIFRTSSTRV